MPRLTAARARLLLGTARVARLATTTGAGLPHIVPVTFVLDGDTIYTAVDGKPKTTPGLRRLDNIRRNPGVALLADHYEEDWTALWWARADGTARVIEDRDVLAVPIGLLTRRYPQYATVALPGPVIAIAVTGWSAWSAAPLAAVPGEAPAAAPAIEPRSPG
jgi:PPOX class probable F420-dependent enzyme